MKLAFFIRQNHFVVALSSIINDVVVVWVKFLLQYFLFLFVGIFVLFSILGYGFDSRFIQSIFKVFTSGKLFGFGRLALS